ncbi:DUF2768 family protein [Jeotgalicoccus meleagridis]|uniref:DUF2768 domain-containing protein n=1 Tax=Jeotgalicoccus meleagridis TaxID=2759181 RepID=A0A6V7RIQ4_9STAP|nr:DUF2768 family protein [Jeotgalicoccus meleagridis]CAD2077772.1 hypothetical protein JEODO184_01238 [Jeotgalicoccus meleagridis]
MFDISRMDLMWVSFVSMGLMALSAVLIYLSRYVITIRIISILVSTVAWFLLALAFLLMVVVIGGSSHA